MISIKKRMTKIIHEQPEDSSYEEILKELAFVCMIERGLIDSKKNKVISHEKMIQRIKTWVT